MFIIKESDQKGIVEIGLGFLKSNAMLLKILLGLVFVPLKNQFHI